MAGSDIRESDLGRLHDIVAALRTGDPDLPGVSWTALQLLGELLEVDEVDVHGMDSARREHFFVQEVRLDEPGELLEGSPAGPAPVSPHGAALVARFWDEYWSVSCSLPDRTGGWGLVINLDADGPDSRRTVEEWCRRHEQPLAHEAQVATPLGPSRQLRVLAWRDGWASFTGRQLTCLDLVHPHVVDAWRRSWRREPPLTAAQRRVLALVGGGHTNRQVARRLGISEATVRTHLQNAFTSLGVNNRVAAVAAAFGSPGAAVPAPRPSGAEHGAFTG